MQIKLLSSDLDGTLAGKADATLAFRDTWERLRAAKKSRAPLLCYNTGRLLNDTRRFIRKIRLPEPDFFVCGVGTSIYDCREKRPLEAFTRNRVQGWDLAKIEEILSHYPNVEKQASEFQNAFKSSWYFYDASAEQINRLRAELERAGLDINLIYSSARDLDILPRWADKGNALKWLIDHLKLKPSQVIVAGDSGNDSSMFRIEGVKRIIVENAQPELFEATVELDAYTADGTCADGVLDGLRHFDVLKGIPVYEPDSGAEKAGLEPEIAMLFDAEELHELSPDQRAFISKAYDEALGAIRRNLTPLGFSACSLNDNEVTGTDVNYRSVWGRDGAITLIGTLGIKDPEIRACQRRTLETLLRHISPNGQIPANVRIDNDTPDYSGVGGIASIDSGIWLIIAFYEFIHATGDLEFLTHYEDRLQRAMDWLAAHDSNNDALLEIPEAGDWTDLFGRSYNVLYDEVLWYRANIAYGRMIELLGDYSKAADYLRWAQTIKSAILRKFWPSTAVPVEGSLYSFADQQTSLGDTHYLLAEVTPFSFNWRCDVFGNILAFLFNVLDLERAKTAFRFMWGVGVNQPYPVANLYPIVTGGDPDWRSYYTVNLLNLPNHYHNGGIWPFIGAMWVRFIHRLGLRDIAHQELVRVAELNQLGKSHQWEFNEWAHGTTGRPMGKAYQAWSASSFIQACHELRLDPAALREDG
ncbi:MAG: HAD-IIB family hydrolase [Puniceicoccaceae bacterium]|nr:MAG: HAD-IIB family hydrolase [Puniceicoccaceae bacterium]